MGSVERQFQSRQLVPARRIPHLVRHKARSALDPRRLAVHARAGLALLALGASIGCAGPSTNANAAMAELRATVTSTESLIASMRNRYVGQWYRTLTFVQTSTYYKPDGTVDRVETWREAAMMPGKLRIDTDTLNGRGAIYANDSLYVFTDNKLARALNRQNELMVLGFDVYFQDPARTLAQLQRLGFDVTKFRRAMHDGVEYYVVGADAGDLTSKQFWIEADRMLFWRVMLPNLRQGVKLTEIRFQKYVPRDGGWVAEEVDFLDDGKRTFFEAYSDVKTNVRLDPAIFDPLKYGATARWWMR